MLLEAGANINPDSESRTLDMVASSFLQAEHPEAFNRIRVLKTYNGDDFGQQTESVAQCQGDLLDISIKVGKKRRLYVN